jgi:Zn-dependent membrane protease YugP
LCRAPRRPFDRIGIAAYTQGYLEGQEITGARKVLSAAALTYLAATAMAIFQLVRLLLIRNSRD